MANVLGSRGVKLLLEEAKRLPLKAFFTTPSCVPAAPGLETNGAQLEKL
jgi:adenine deaminase